MDELKHKQATILKPAALQSGMKTNMKGSIQVESSIRAKGSGGTILINTEFCFPI